MNLKWRESVEYFSSYASLKCCVGEIRKRDREIHKQYEPRMLMPFGINLKKRKRKRKGGRHIIGIICWLA